MGSRVREQLCVESRHAPGGISRPASWHEHCVPSSQEKCWSRNYMNFKIEVGEIEKHQIEFNHNQLMGCLQIKVDRKPVVRLTRLFNEPVREVYEFPVGQMEKTDVRIEKLRNQLLGSRNSVYVDNRLVRVFEGV
jgi:hypothetical protein